MVPTTSFLRKQMQEAVSSAVKIVEIDSAANNNEISLKYFMIATLTWSQLVNGMQQNAGFHSQQAGSGT